MCLHDISGICGTGTFIALKVAKIPVGTPVDTGQALFTDFMLLQRMIINSIDTVRAYRYTLQSRDDGLGPDIRI